MFKAQIITIVKDSWFTFVCQLVHHSFIFSNTTSGWLITTLNSSLIMFKSLSVIKQATSKIVSFSISSPVN